ncbi:36190_t:CDS:2, partial [Racocetra persica]
DNNNDKPSSSQLSVIKILQCTIPPHKGTKKINIHRAVDPAFRQPFYKVLRKNILFANTNAKKQIYNLLNKTSHWLNKQFELNEILLCIEPMPYPHTNTAIKEFLISKVQEFNLQNKLTCVVTNNGTNMVAAIKNWDNIE